MVPVFDLFGDLRPNFGVEIPFANDNFLPFVGVDETPLDETSLDERSVKESFNRTLKICLNSGK